jgi:hypothetical protein
VRRGRSSKPEAGGRQPLDVVVEEHAGVSQDMRHLVKLRESETKGFFIPAEPHQLLDECRGNFAIHVVDVRQRAESGGDCVPLVDLPCRRVETVQHLH